MKLGHWINPGKRYAGTVHLADIGIPQRPNEAAGACLLADDLVHLIPERGHSDDKFSAGSVLVVGGSPGLTGAPLLASLGAARGGAGYVTVALPGSLLSAADSQLEVMGLGLAESGGFHCAEGADSLSHGRREPDAIVVGPGIGRGDSVEGAVEKVIFGSEGPVVVDADALRAFAGRPEALASAGADLVLTPHAGEMAALLGKPGEEVDSNRLASAHELAERARATVVLKGDDTIVITADGLAQISPGGAPALATAGSGDVLSGLIASFLAKGIDPSLAAGAAVLVHLEAGRIAGMDGTEGVLAGDIAGLIPEARNRLRRAGR
jgi:NAD(P)H-hydrate epimerase